MPKTILIVEDDALQRQMLGTLLRRKLDFGSHEAANGREALNILETDNARQIKLVIMDLTMPVMGGMETLEVISQRYPGLPVIMLTGSKDIDDAVKALHLGAVDFISKPYEGERMIVTIKNAMKISTMTKEISRLQSEKQGRFIFENIVGHDTGLNGVVQMGRKAASADIPVLITGETGTGKEVFAQAIHGESSRAGRPFIAVNCGAIPAQLVESTLFGHEKGAFTGATDKAIGKFREAEGGTIFLDEVGELPLDTQVKLLRVLQQKEVEPVGASKAVSVNVRIISATNRNLGDEISAGRFREDLYFRLNVLHMALPPLRERREDILMLLDHFIERHCAAEGCPPKVIEEATKEKLVQYDWPGNVRQLENAIKRAMVLSDGNMLDDRSFSALLNGKPHLEESQAYTQDLQPPGTGAHIQLVGPDSKFKTIEQIETETMHAALAHYDGNITQAAKALGMAKSTFYKKMKKSED